MSNCVPSSAIKIKKFLIIADRYVYPPTGTRTGTRFHCPQIKNTRLGKIKLNSKLRHKGYGLVHTYPYVYMYAYFMSAF